MLEKDSFIISWSAKCTPASTPVSIANSFGPQFFFNLYMAYFIKSFRGPSTNINYLWSQPCLCRSNDLWRLSLLTLNQNCYIKTNAEADDWIFTRYMRSFDKIWLSLSWVTNLAFQINLLSLHGKGTLGFIFLSKLGYSSFSCLLQYVLNFCDLLHLLNH